MLCFNKEKTAFYISCACGCDEAITFRIVTPCDEKDTDYAFITYSRGSFYAEQNTFWDKICKKLSRIWAIIRNKDYYYSDIILTKEDFTQFVDYLNDVKNKQ